VDYAIAVYLHADADPRFYRTDESFNAELVRSLRKLDAGNSSSYVNDGKTRRVHVELRPKARRIMAQWITAALGPVGLHIAALERQKLEGGAKAKEDFKAALSQMRA